MAYVQCGKLSTHQMNWNIFWQWRISFCVTPFFFFFFFWTPDKKSPPFQLAAMGCFTGECRCCTLKILHFCSARLLKNKMLGQRMVGIQRKRERKEKEEGGVPPPFTLSLSLFLCTSTTPSLAGPQTCWFGPFVCVVLGGSAISSHIAQMVSMHASVNSSGFL